MVCNGMEWYVVFCVFTSFEATTKKTPRKTCKQGRLVFQKHTQMQCGKVRSFETPLVRII